MYIYIYATDTQRGQNTPPLVATRSANPVFVYNKYVLTYIYICMCIHTYV